MFFYHIMIKDNERNLYQDLLTIENTDSDLKMHALHYVNELLVRVILSFQKLLQTMDYKTTGLETSDHVGCFRFADWLTLWSRWPQHSANL